MTAQVRKFRISDLFSLGTKLCLQRLLLTQGDLDAPEDGLTGDLVYLAALILEAQAQGHLCLPGDRMGHFLTYLENRWKDQDPTGENKLDLGPLRERLEKACDAILAGAPRVFDLVSPVLSRPLFGILGAGITELDPPFLLLGKVFFTNRQYERDLKLSTALAARLTRPPHSPVNPSTQTEPWVVAQPDRQIGRVSEAALAACRDQSAAVEASRGRGLFVLSGGPGTGKTTTVFHMLRAAWLDGIRRVGLAAPTGRAAQRLQESLHRSLDDFNAAGHGIPPGFGPWLRSLEASTVHRYAGRGRPLGLSLMDLEMLVVDEASMMDAELSGALLLGLDSQASLVLVGDHRQLPSVDEGALMADLWRLAKGDAQGAWFSQLTVSLRAQGTVLAIPGMIARDEAVGRILEEFKKLSPFGGGNDGTFWTILASPGEEKAWLKNAERQRICTQALSASMQKIALQALGDMEKGGSNDHNRDGIVDALSSAVLLSPVRKGLWGVEELNAAMAAHWTGTRVADSPQVQGIHVFEGMPLMVTTNDLSLGLFNGERGLAHQNPDTGLWYLYLSTKRRVALAQIANLELSFAMTIHKSQGSEFNTVHVVLDESSCTRELLYTGLTRAKKAWHVLSSKDALESCLSTATERYSVMEEHIRARLNQ